MTADREQLSELAYHLVRAGYGDRDDAVAEVIEILDVAGPDLAFAGEAVDTALEAVRDEENHWELTDNDRLARAVIALEVNGIVVRENFTCCQTCGFGEIGDEVAATEELGVMVRGFAFFHWQDTERAMSGQGLCLSYGAMVTADQAAYERAALAIGHEVVESLEREGLVVSWPGDLDRRIEVDMMWRRRRFTAPPLDVENVETP